MVQTVDDVVSSEADIEMTKAYPSEPGWDSFYGYGRINAAAAVEALVAWNSTLRQRGCAGLVRHL